MRSPSSVPCREDGTYDLNTKTSFGVSAIKPNHVRKDVFILNTSFLLQYDNIYGIIPLKIKAILCFASINSSLNDL